MQSILTINQVNKTMGKRHIIKNISFETYGGEVFGFLGPNGAGKTTTIKMIFGLIRNDSGSIEVCGKNVQKNFEQALQNMGGIVENPETYKYLTGLQNLKQYRRMRDNVGKERLQEVIKFVGLENRIHEKVKRYSLGMKQRLGLAQAILHRPKLLILDEPTNGLDPMGIRELRDLLRKMTREQGISVLVSSHLLSEMELMCDRVGIIVEGKMIGVKTTKELIEQSTGSQKMMRFTVNQPEQAIELLEQAGILVENKAEQTFDIAVNEDKMLAEINTTLISAGITLLSITPVEQSLEDVFIQLTGGGNSIA